MLNFYDGVGRAGEVFLVEFEMLGGLSLFERGPVTRGFFLVD